MQSLVISMSLQDTDDLGFRIRTTSQGAVHISRNGREVTVLRGKAAQSFLGKIAGAEFGDIQQRCARVTGNYKRPTDLRKHLGNE